MSNSKSDVQAIFCEALDSKSPEELQDFLDAACGDDPELRAQIEESLDSHHEAGNFLVGAAQVEATLGMPLPTEAAGRVIGPYKLLEQIGEGGMGTVFMAEQTKPIRRMVALKIIKPGMDTKEVIARFEAERQALALMDHPHIAKVLEAGTTDNGRPYFVMELVKGIPLTDFCNREKLSTDERLKLLIDVFGRHGQTLGRSFRKATRRFPLPQAPALRRRGLLAQRSSLGMFIV
jgi:hypothetical protein